MDKKQLLTESKVFCMFPWMHLNVTPKGNIYPCCSSDYTTPFGSTKETTLAEAFNNDKMKDLRLKMVNGEKSDICTFCYKHEDAGPFSFRTYSIEHFGKRFDELMPLMQADGTMDEFRMHYMDIRFSNLCNFKCRTCGDEFSSSWALESSIERKKSNIKTNKIIPILKHVDDNKGLVLAEVIDQIDNIDLVYFAGGEPVITEEHYLMLEAMIRKGRRDIILRYNTNASSLKFKDYDLLDLWKNFDKIEVSCSIDHYGERAEWLRKGTEWGLIESNLLKFRDLDYVDFQMNTVFSIFNYLTVTELYEYLISKNIVRKDDWYHSLYLAVNPVYYCAQAMPKELKEVAKSKATMFINNASADFQGIKNLIGNAVSFADSADTWEEQRDTFLPLTNRIDKIRDEDFFKTFPELQVLSTL